MKRKCKCEVSPEQSPTTTSRKRTRLSSNSSRRPRRKKSLVKYYNRLKQARFERTTSTLCSALTVVDLTDMEWQPATLPTSSSTEVAEWHKQEQIAYWKSRALALEYENRMLIQHIRDVYAKQTEDYANYYGNEGEVEYPEIEDETGPVADAPAARIENVKTPVPIREPPGKKMGEEMEKLYGGTSRKIMGMETAVQLNYDLRLEEKDGRKARHWPHTPLNLKF